MKKKRIRVGNQINACFNEEDVLRIEFFRDQHNIPSRAEAVKLLVAIALDQCAGPPQKPAKPKGRYRRINLDGERS